MSTPLRFWLRNKNVLYILCLSFWLLSSTITSFVMIKENGFLVRLQNWRKSEKQQHRMLQQYLRFSSSNFSRLFLIRIFRLSWLGEGRGTPGSSWKRQYHNIRITFWQVSQELHFSRKICWWTTQNSELQIAISFSFTTQRPFGVLPEYCLTEFWADSP